MEQTKLNDLIIAPVWKRVIAFGIDICESVVENEKEESDCQFSETV